VLSPRMLYFGTEGGAACVRSSFVTNALMVLHFSVEEMSLPVLRSEIGLVINFHIY